jgi:hypothetical protein
MIQMHLILSFCRFYNLQHWWNYQGHLQEWLRWANYSDLASSCLWEPSGEQCGNLGSGVYQQVDADLYRYRILRVVSGMHCSVFP